MVWSLLKGATDIIGKVPVGTIEVTEVGPGGVSSMRFTVQDPTKAVTFTRREKILYADTTGTPQFLGYVENADIRPVAIGREIDVEATGAEAILDWLVQPGGVVIAAGTNFPNAINQIITTKTATPNALVDATRTGSAAQPIGNFVRPAIGTAPFLVGGVNWAIPAATLRQQIEQLNEKCSYQNAGVFLPFNALVSVDFSLGIRAWEDDITLQPTDYTTLTVTTAGPLIQANLRAAKDWQSAVDRVYVIGSGAVGSVGFRPVAFGAWPHREAILNDPAIANANERDMGGDNYLIAHGGEDRGEFDLVDFTPALTVHAGSLVSITDAMTGATGTYRIAEIRKTYNSDNTQDWHVTYGRLAPSAMRQVIVGAR